METLVRYWMWPLFIVVALATQVKTLSADWQKNLAILQLRFHWMEQRVQLLDPSCIEAGDFREIKEGLGPSLIIEQGKMSNLTHLGRVLWLEGNCTGAVTLWERASLNGDLSASFELLRIGSYQGITPYLQGLLADFAYHEAIKAKNDGQNSTANEWFTRSFDLVPQHRAGIHLAEYYHKLGDSISIKNLWQALANAHSEEDQEYWWATGELIALQEQWEIAAQTFLTGAKLSSDPYDFYLRAGNMWERGKNWEQAIDVYQLALKYHPEKPTPYMYIAKVYHITKRYREAIEWYLDVKALWPDDYAPNYYLGQIYLKIENFPQAQHYLETALELKPTHPYSMYSLAKLSYQQGDLETAESYLMNAIDSQSDPQLLTSYWIQLAGWRIEMNNCEGAKDAYNAALALGGNRETIQIDLLPQECTD